MYKRQALKPGGKLIILEFSKPQNEAFREIYDLFSFEVIPKIGEFIAQTEESYRYLAESIRMHPTQEELKKMLESVGIRATPNCSCNAKATAMNKNGIEWCKNNKDTILSWLQEEAVKRKLPFFRFFARRMINIAISRAEKAENNS